MERAQEWAAKKGGRLIIYKGRNRSLWECRDGHRFYLTEYKVKRRGKWCLQCGASISERAMRQFFQKTNIPFTAQAQIQAVPGRKYDFCCQYQGIYYLVEYDGEQHFHFVKKYHKRKDKFLKGQEADRLKTWGAIHAGYNVIRIDCSQKDFLWEHLCYALQLKAQLYLSNPNNYRYLF